MKNENTMKKTDHLPDVSKMVKYKEKPSSITQTLNKCQVFNRVHDVKAWEKRLSKTDD